MQPFLDELAAWSARWQDTFGILGAAATTLAVIAVLWIARHEANERKRADERAETAKERALKMQTERAEESRAEREIAQARGVAAWVSRTIPEDQGPGGYTVQRVTEDTWVVANHSPLPIYSVQVRLYWDQIAQHDTIKLPEPIPPGAEHREFYGRRDHVRVFPIAVAFQDAAQLWWIRDRHGVLHRQHDPVSWTLGIAENPDV